MNQLQQDCVALIQDFKSKELVPDWRVMFTHEEAHETFYDAVNNIIYHIATSDLIDEDSKTQFIGQLSKHGARMTYAISFKDEALFAKEGAAALATIEKLINSGTWYKAALERFDLLDTISEDAELESLDRALVAKLNPVMLVMEISRAITAEEQDECCEEDEE